MLSFPRSKLLETYERHKGGALQRAFWVDAPYGVLNTATGQLLQTDYTDMSARQSARWVNEHEERCGRPEVYAPVIIDRSA